MKPFFVAPCSIHSNYGLELATTVNNWFFGIKNAVYIIYVVWLFGPPLCRYYDDADATTGFKKCVRLAASDAPPFVRRLQPMGGRIVRIVDIWCQCGTQTPRLMPTHAASRASLPHATPPLRASQASHPA